MKRKKILLLCNRPVKNADASTVTDHLDAFTSFSQHDFFQLSFLRKLPSRIVLDRFDVIVIHYSIAIGYQSEHYISQATREKIKKFKGLKTIFIQDEYREIYKVHDALNFMGIDVLFTCVPLSEIEKVYPAEKLPGLRKINNLTGYMPDRLIGLKLPLIKERRIDIGYRSRKPPFWLGKLSVEKWQIADKIKEKCAGHHFKLDISYNESDRIYGQKWVDFVSSCKIMLGVESGASVFDFTGELQQTVETYQEQNPSADFAAIRQKFLEAYEGKIYLNQISPRCFESAALKTVMLLYEGNYSGILKPWRHYLPLKKDFSNFNKIISYLKDDDKLQEIADRTYLEIACNQDYSYKKFVRLFDRVVNEEYASRKKSQSDEQYSDLSFKMQLLLSPMYICHKCISIIGQKIILGTFLRNLALKIWKKTPLTMKYTLRPFFNLIGR